MARLYALRFCVHDYEVLLQLLVFLQPQQHELQRAYAHALQQLHAQRVHVHVQFEKLSSQKVNWIFSFLA